MKTLKLLSLLCITALTMSCSSVRVSSDYDEAVDFNQYKTYGFLKSGIDKAEISDLDKKRIMRAIETEMQKKRLYQKRQACIAGKYLYQSQ